MSAYEKAWLVYLLCASGILLVLWRLCTALRLLRALRVPVLLLAMALLLTPVYMPEQDGWYAPATVGAGLLLLDEGVPGMMSLLETPLQIGAVLVLGWLLWFAIRLAVQRYRTARQAPTDNPGPPQENTHEV